MKFFSRVSIVFVFCLLFFSALFEKPALAQTAQTPLSSFSTANVSPEVPRDIHSLAQIVTSEVISTMICQLAGIDITTSNGECIGVDPQTHQIGMLKPGNGGLLAVAFSGIQFEFNIPIHSGDYIHYMANRFGIAPHAYAATTGGVGFTGLQPLLGLWVAFRNIVYLFFVIIFVLVGIAIMLRVQIDPRTVMTLENQLPKIVIGLILVTFSYAIAGFMIDAMWVVTFLVVNVLTSTDANAATNTAGGHDLANVATSKLLEGPLQYVNDMMASNGLGGILDLAGSAMRITADVMRNIMTGDTVQKIGIMPQSGDTGGGGCSWWQIGLASIFPPAGVACAVANVSTDLAKALGGAIAWLIGWILGSLAGLVILIALLITLFRVWFTLLQAYAYIVLDVILAPFHIGAGLIPGSAIGFGSWLRGIAANLLVFPAVVFMFVLARVLLDAFYGNATPVADTGIVHQAYAAGVAVSGGSLFSPPLIGSLNGGGAGNPLGAFLALAIIFATPGVLNVIKKALQVQDNGLGAGALAGMGAGGKTLGGITRRTANLATAYKIDPLHASASQRVWSSIFR